MYSLTPFAKNLRKRMTDTERCLWKHLRTKQFSNLKWRRQEPIGKYIVDFVCFEKRVVVECDGGQHAFPESSDKERDAWFAKEGFRVLRFWNTEVLQNTEDVLNAIFSACQMSSPSP